MAPQGDVKHQQFVGVKGYLMNLKTLQQENMTVYTRLPLLLVQFAALSNSSVGSIRRIYLHISNFRSPDCS